ncbi:hypothetical protein ACA910_003006 [Epithemia clementina (nom. ined.)]
MMICSSFRVAIVLACYACCWMFLNSFYLSSRATSNALTEHSRLTQFTIRSTPSSSSGFSYSNGRSDNPTKLNTTTTAATSSTAESQARKPANGTLMTTMAEAKSSNDNSSLSSSPLCAINLFGLPRAFKSLVLPSLKTNLIPFNPSCDYFVHYYNKTFEPGGRSGAGGAIHPNDVQLLTEAVHAVNPSAVVHYMVEDEMAFQQRHALTLLKMRHDLYKPRELDFDATANIIRMWNSIQSAWELMMKYSQLQRREYARVAFLRLDVMFATPVDIWEIANHQKDVQNKYAVIPAFGAWPVNDRMFYGPLAAAREWAARRFELMDEHAQWAQLNNQHGIGIHSEKFVAYRVLPNIEQLGYQIWEHDKVCFFRARADETLWVNDCEPGTNKKKKTAPNVLKNAVGKQASRIDFVQVVEKAINRPCLPGTKEWIKKTNARTILCKMETAQNRSTNR